MRITFISAAPNLSGGQRVIAIYARQLAARGHRVEIVCMKRRHPSIVRTVKNFLRGRGLPRWSYRGPSHYKNYDVDFRIVTHSGTIVERDIPDGDVLIATWWETAEAAANLPKAKGVKVYFVQGHEVFSYLPVDRSAATYRLPFRKIVVSNWLSDVMRDTYSDAESTIVPNAVDTEMFHAQVRQANVEPIIGMMYSTERIKGSELCIQAIRIARNVIPEITTVAFGHNMPIDQSLISTFDNFYMAPPQERLREIYGGCRAWLFGSSSEGFGLPILEAMACRTPVIATPAGAAPELIGRGGGILLKANDPIEMAKAIVHIVRMPTAEWQVMSNAAFRTATSYSWSDAAIQFEAALQAAVSRKWKSHCLIQHGSRNGKTPASSIS
jgi:glycosyltransferase involved in cell wall biosynthesis